MAQGVVETLVEAVGIPPGADMEALEAMAVALVVGATVVGTAGEGAGPGEGLGAGLGACASSASSLVTGPETAQMKRAAGEEVVSVAVTRRYSTESTWRCGVPPISGHVYVVRPITSHNSKIGFQPVPCQLPRISTCMLGLDMV